MPETTQEKPDTAELPSDSQAKPWLCGEPYKYPIPEEKGNPWETLLGPLLEQDRAQCDAWNDEVQNLLIFAGLFSAVLTAFVIESYKNLQPDPNDQIIALLSQISTGIHGQETPRNVAQLVNAGSTRTEPFSPTQSSIRINAVWFTSLVLSLATVLIGIVCLQWIREHKRYPARISPKDKFAMLYMRSEALQRWYVPEIFSALPILLQLALLLFFAGLVDFVLPFGVRVSVSVIVAIGLPVLFLIMTTVLPSLQAVVFLVPLSPYTEQAPAQCPYKSPQSRILRRFMTLSESLFRCYVGIARRLHSLANLHRRRRAHENISVDYYKTQDIWPYVHSIWKTRPWEYYDQCWLLLRNAYAKSAFDQTWMVQGREVEYSARVGPIYDATMGLQGVPIVNFDGNYPLSYTQYHCIADLSDSIVGDKSPLLDCKKDLGFQARYNSYFQNLLFGESKLCQRNATVTSQVDAAKSGTSLLAMMHEENCLIFLADSMTPASLVLVWKHLAELHVRLGNSLLSQVPMPVSSDPVDAGVKSAKYSDYILLSIYTWPLYLPRSDGLDSDLTFQNNLGLRLFFKALADPQIDEETLMKSFHSKIQVRDFIQVAVVRQPREEIKPFLDFVSSALLASLKEKPGKRADLFFYCAALYADSMINQPAVQDFGDDREIATVRSFLPVLNTYLQCRGTPEAVADFNIPTDVSDEWWSTLLGQEVEVTNDDDMSNFVEPLQDLSSSLSLGEKIFNSFHHRKISSPV